MRTRSPASRRLENSDSSDEQLRFYETAKFKKLTAKWYKKLERTGFEDIEDVNSPREFLKAAHDTRFKINFDSSTFEERQRYFQLASQLVFTYPFKNPKEKKVWKLHSEGMSERVIAEITKTTHSVVRRIVENTRLAIKRDAKDILEDLNKPIVKSKRKTK